MNNLDQNTTCTKSKHFLYHYRWVYLYVHIQVAQIGLWSTVAVTEVLLNASKEKYRVIMQFYLPVSRYET